MGHRLAVFDICGTLYRSNTTFDFLDFYWKEKEYAGPCLFFKLSRTKIGKIVWVLISKVARRDIFRILAVRTLKDEKLAEVNAAAEKFVKDYLPSRARQEVFELLSDQRRIGSEIILMSASICPVVKAIADQVGIQQYYCSELAGSDGKLLGYISHDIHGRKKELFLNKFQKDTEFVFVTDNKEDLPLLRMSSKPYIVAQKKDKGFWSTKRDLKASIIEVK